MAYEEGVACSMAVDYDGGGLRKCADGGAV